MISSIYFLLFLSIALYLPKTIVANGKLVAVTDNGNVKKWSFNMEHPMSSYLVSFAVGDFSKKTIVSSRRQESLNKDQSFFKRQELLPKTLFSSKDLVLFQ